MCTGVNVILLRSFLYSKDIEQAGEDTRNPVKIKQKRVGGVSTSFCFNPIERN